MNTKLLLSLFFIIFSFSSYGSDLTSKSSLIHQAVENDDLRALSDWFEREDPKDPEQSFLFEALRHAAFKGKTEIFNNLLGRTTKQFIESYGEKLLAGFFEYWDLERRWWLAFQLIDKGVNPNFVDGEGKTLLHHAVEGNHVNMKSNQVHYVTALIGLRADVNKVDISSSKAPLYSATVNNNLPIALALLEAGASMAPVNESLMTPLHWVKKDALPMAKLLLEFGADPEAKDELGYSSFGVATKLNDKNMKKLFSDYIKAKNQDKLFEFRVNLKTARLAQGSAHQDRTEFRVSEGHVSEISQVPIKNTNAPTRSKPKKASARPASPPNIEDHFDGAIYINDVQAVKMHLLNDVKLVEKRYRHGNTALHLAVQQNFPEIVTVLLRNNASMDTKNDDGQTPRDLAKNNVILMNIFEDYLNKLDNDVLAKIHYAQIPANIFGLKEKVLKEARISFMAKEIIFSLNEKTFRLLFTTDPKNVDNKIVFTKPNKQPLIFKGMQTHKKNKPIPGCIWFVDNLVLQKEAGQLYLSGKLNIGNAFKWKLEGQSKAKNEESLPIETPKPQKSEKTSETAVKKIETPTIYPTKMQLIGTYRGTLDQTDYVVEVPDFDETSRFALIFTTKAGPKNLWVIAHKDPTNVVVTSLEPICKDTNKFVAGQTTFDGKRAQRKDGSLRFNSFIKFSDLSNNQPLCLSVETHRGLLFLTKDSEERRQEDQDALENLNEHWNEDLPEEENDNEYFEQREFYFQDVAPGQLLIELDQPVVPNQPSKRNRRKKEPVKAGYFVEQTAKERKEYGPLGFSLDEEEKARREYQRLLPKMIQLGDARQAEENKEVWGKKEPEKSPSNSVMPHDNTLREPLNRESLFTANPLYPIHETNDDDKVWFAYGWVSHDGQEYRENPRLNFVFSLKNFNNLELFAPNASWCSLFTRELGEENFQHGMNVHCSYHKNGDKRYFNISHFGLFQIEANQDNDGYLMYKIPEPGDKKRVAFVLHPFSKIKGRWRAGNKTLDSRRSALCFVGCTYNVTKFIDEKACQERREKLALNLAAHLSQSPPIKVFYGRNSLYRAVLDQNNQGQLITMDGYPWRKIEHWSVQMINDHLAFVSILFQNNRGKMEAITTKVEYDIN